MLRQCLVRPYEHVKHVSNFKSHGRRWRPCGRIFKFRKFRRKEKEIEPFDVISENRWPNGFFWPNKKKIVFPLLSADSRYFRIYALNKSKSNHYPPKKLFYFVFRCDRSLRSLFPCDNQSVNTINQCLVSQRCLFLKQRNDFFGRLNPNNPLLKLKSPV